MPTRCSRPVTWPGRRAPRGDRSGERRRPPGSSWDVPVRAGGGDGDGLPLGAGDARYRLGGPRGPPTPCTWACSALRLEAVGGFDETLERNQDYELNWRLRQKGGVVWFDPGLAVEYRRAHRALWRQYFDYGYWKRIVLRRHPESLRWRQLAAPASSWDWGSPRPWRCSTGGRDRRCPASTSPPPRVPAWWIWCGEATRQLPRAGGAVGDASPGVGVHRRLLSGRR